MNQAYSTATASSFTISTSISMLTHTMSINSVRSDFGFQWYLAYTIFPSYHRGHGLQPLADCLEHAWHQGMGLFWINLKVGQHGCQPPHSQCSLSLSLSPSTRSTLLEQSLSPPSMPPLYTTSRKPCPGCNYNQIFHFVSAICSSHQPDMHQILFCVFVKLTNNKNCLSLCRRKLMQSPPIKKAYTIFNNLTNHEDALRFHPSLLPPPPHPSQPFHVCCILLS
jgi:hypothetical protein